MTIQTLIVFLGRAQKRDGGYQKAHYAFGDSIDPPSAFVGWNLQRRVQPNKLIILGTNGSMWDHLIEHDTGIGDNFDQQAREALWDAVSAKQVTAEHLRPVEAALNDHLACEVRLRLIPYAYQRDEQIELLRLMADEVEPGAHVTLDVTHGFRHLPMLGLLAALYLRGVRQAKIAGIWYAAFDPEAKGQPTPVINLAGLLDAADWISALATFDKDGDYGVFTPLLAREELPDEAGHCLTNAAFFERTNRIGQARGQLRTFQKTLAAANGLHGMGQLFEPLLQARIDWADNDFYYQRQRALAIDYCERGDYLRSTLFAFEAFLTQLLQRRNLSNTDNADTRQTIKQEYENAERQRQPRSEEYTCYRLLRDIRNQLAHGHGGDRIEAQQAIASAETLHRTLMTLIKQLLPE